MINTLKTQRTKLAGAFLTDQENALLEAWRRKRGWSRSAVIREALRRLTAPRAPNSQGGQNAA